MTPASLVWATDIDVLPADRQVTRRGDHLVVRSPSNPGHYWGNLLIYDTAPAPGDGARWTADFAAAFPGLTHCTLAWDLTDGTLGAAESEFPGFEPERMVGLIARPEEITAHPRADQSVAVRTLDPADDADGWDDVLALWLAQQAVSPDPTPPDYLRFARRRLAELRRLFRAGRGAWFVAEEAREVVGSLGVVITDGRLRYQAVDTRLSHRGRGIASRLVVEAAHRAQERWALDSLVIAAIPGYHALGIYESLGFRPVERVNGVCRWPAADAG